MKKNKEDVIKKCNNRDIDSKKCKFFTKDNITYFIIFLLDIIMVIFCAKRNKVNYVKVFHHDLFVGKNYEIMFGRNYINILITFFFYFYIILMNRFFLKKKNTLMFVILCLLLLIIINIVLFSIFTVKIY